MFVDTEPCLFESMRLFYSGNNEECFPLNVNEFLMTTSVSLWLFDCQLNSVACKKPWINNRLAVTIPKTSGITVDID